MSNLLNVEKINLKNNPNITEDMIQEFIFNNPSSLGLGNIEGIRREKTQPSGGRLDILLGNDDGLRYEVEIQLGSTDPSHIIRTIEYWDTERKRYPKYEHCAVIIAEDITSRFMNVIQLFNGQIPIIAIQISAIKTGNDISLVFTKVLDRLELGTDEEDSYEIVDRNYWENKSTKKMLAMVDKIHTELNEYTGNYELKYNKFYIGISKEGIVKNFIMYRPKKSYMYLVVKSPDDANKFSRIENAGLECSYKSAWKELYIRIDNYEDFENNKELISEMVKDSMGYFNID